MDNSAVFWLVIAVTSIILAVKLSRHGMRPKNYPPGPPTLPIIGNLHQMPTKDLHLQFEKWANEYGPIFSLKLGGQTLIVMSSDIVIKDLLEKRSNIYSTRMDMFLREANEDMNVLIRGNDEVWRQQRKMYHLRLNSKISNNYLPYQMTDSLQLMNDLLQKPERFDKHLQRYTASIATTVMYGWRTTSPDIPAVAGIIEWTDRTAAVMGTLQIVDWYPFLRPIFRRISPRFSSFKAELVRLHEIEIDLFFGLLETAKKNIREGKVYPSFIRDMLLSTDKEGTNEKEIAYNAGHGLAGATDTQWNTTMTFVKAMIMFPEVQKEAQRELDRVVGNERLPDWSDRENLPYIRGVVEESFRWIPTTLLGAIPHAASKDDYYNGYFIPKGAGLMSNVWYINNDPKRTPNPREFNPLRHSPENTALEINPINPDSTKRPHFNFGAGRRACPGYHVAERGVYLAISRILWGFNLERCRDADGNLIPINRDAVTPGMIVAPERYDAVIKPRDQARADIISKAWADASLTLDENGNYTEEFFQKTFLKNINL